MAAECTVGRVGKRGRRRGRGAGASGAAERSGGAADRSGGAAASTTDYLDADGNVLTLRDALSAGTLAKLRETPGGPAASGDDLWRRHTEMLFERLAVRWEIAGLPLTKQKELLGRFRMADGETQRWVRQTLDEHVRRAGIE
jgi:hypothetical protein